MIGDFIHIIDVAIGSAVGIGLTIFIGIIIKAYRWDRKLKLQELYSQTKSNS